MFQDERINKESGRIYRNCIIISLIIILMISVMKVIYYINIDHFQVLYLIAEVVLIIESVVILGIGELRLLNKTKDELFYYKRYGYYKKAIIVYLIIGLLGFAIALPFEFGKEIMDLSSQTILIHLESFGFLFLVYSFKKARINFNYSFIEENNSVYAKKIEWNILKLFFCHLVLLGISMIINLIVTNDNYLSIFIFFLISFISLTAIYLLISFVEKLSNTCIEKGKKNYALFIVGGLNLLELFIYFICEIIAVLLSKNVDYNIIEVSRTLNEIANNIHLFYMPCFVWLLMSIYCSPAKNKALDIGINIFVILALLWLTIGQCLYPVEYTIIYRNDINAVQTYNTSVNIIIGLFGFGMCLDLAYISYRIFLKTRKYKWWFVLPFLYFLAVSFNIMSHYFLKTTFFSIVFCLNMLVIIILVILLKDYIADSE